MNCHHLLMCLTLPLATHEAPSPRSSQEEKVSEETAARIEERCNEFLWGLYEQHGFPGLSAALILPDGTELAFPVGFADEEAERDMAPGDRLLSGSIGKTYVTAAAHHLKQAGKLDFASKAIEFFEGEEWFLELPNAKTMTVEQLLRHEAGMPRYVFDIMPTCVADPDKVWAPQELLETVAGRAPLFPAGEGWAYADTHFIVVGMIIEKVSGMKYYDYVRTNLLDPNGLADTVDLDSRNIEGVTQGYSQAFAQLGMPERMLEDGVFAINPQFEWCGGGYASSPTDLAKWGWLLYRGEAMKGEYLDTMLATVPAGQLGPGAEYGLGVITRPTEMGRVIGHDGIMTGFLATMGYYEDLGVAGAVMANTDNGRRLGMREQQILEKLASIAMEELDH